MGFGEAVRWSDSLSLLLGVGGCSKRFEVGSGYTM